jgi:hypothetical protein
MCLMDAPATPKTPDPPAPAAAPVASKEPDLKVKRGKSRAEIAQGKSRYRVDSKKTNTGSQISSGTGLNIPT